MVVQVAAPVDSCAQKATKRLSSIASIANVVNFFTAQTNTKIGVEKTKEKGKDRPRNHSKLRM
jgi:hypothetical protein